MRPLLLVAVLGLATSACDDDVFAVTPWDPDVRQVRFSPEVTNPLLPLPVGATWRYEAETPAGVERTDVEVLPGTQAVDGVDCRVVRTAVRRDGEVVEEMRSFRAQDEDGNVWAFGADVAQLDQGEVVGTEGSWAAGRRRAKPGYAMLADPAVGDGYYRAFAPGHVEDQVEVVATGLSVDTAAGRFDGCVRTRTFTRLDAGAEALTTSCPEVGPVLVVEEDAQHRLVALDLR